MTKPEVAGKTVASGVRSGVDWCVNRTDWGTFNGYARIPVGHPWRAQPEGEYLDGLADPPQVHGGVTYGPDEHGWIGFDTAHIGDEVPVFAVLGLPQPHPKPHRWTIAEVENECTALADQIAGAMKPRGRS